MSERSRSKPSEDEEKPSNVGGEEEEMAAEVMEVQTKNSLTEELELPGSEHL